MTADPRRPRQPRIPPLDQASMTESQRALTGIGAANVLRTLVRHQELLAPWLALGGKLLFSGHLSVRERELMILRVALRTACEYEWANHVAGALAGGASEDEIRGLSDDAAVWSAADRALLDAVDELCAADCVSDETWAVLAAARDDVQLIEIVCLVGYYRMNAGLLNSLGVQPDEAGLPRLGRLPPHAAASPQRAPAPIGPTPPVASEVRAVDESRTGVDGTWTVLFHHPSGDQQLTLVLMTSDRAISGSVTNPSLGTTVSIVEGTVQGSRVSFKAPITTPVQVDIDFDGVVDGDSISGQVTIRGGGTFPFDGTRTAAGRTTPRGAQDSISTT
jgi:4-carboxymuconolactone decarboxylase